MTKNNLLTEQLTQQQQSLVGAITPCVMAPTNDN